MTKFIPLRNPEECLGTYLQAGSRECTFPAPCAAQDRRIQANGSILDGQTRYISFCLHPKVEEIIMSPDVGKLAVEVD